jgi:hypothetical protein
MRYVIAILVVLLLVMQQDYWLWNDTTLVFGFLPGCLAWHMLVSVCAALVWLLTVLFAWPVDETSTDAAEGDAS